MKGNKSTGDDDISARFIKLAAPYITDSIVKICNCSIKTGRSPDTWKKDLKDSGDDISNYRPISILPIASKILEKHVSIHLYEYMTSYNLLHQKQSGFRACKVSRCCILPLHGSAYTCFKYSSLIMLYIYYYFIHYHLCIMYVVYLNVWGPEGRWANAHWVHPL